MRYSVRGTTSSCHGITCGRSDNWGESILTAVIPAQAGISFKRTFSVQCGLVYDECMRDEKSPAVYILASRKNGVLYVGVTSGLWNRVACHKDGSVKGFTQKYNVHLLVWYEHHHDMNAAITREKQLKKWNRAWKLELIEKFNPEWLDLHDSIDVDGTMAELQGDSRLRGNDDVKAGPLNLQLKH